ncbi:MAG TPA: protein kinase [Planctomycetota bacterium]|nr:protein kinase [Planctomycetota bacterium]
MASDPQHIPSSGEAAAVSPSGQGSAGFGTPSIPIQDLSGDKLVHSAPKSNFNNSAVPTLGGIPLLAKLGQGGMGAVYYGIHPRLKQEVAVKVLPFPLLASQPDLVKRFFFEAQLAAKIKSPHLVSVSDVNEENGLFYLVMEYVTGKSAGSYLRQLKKSGQTGLDESDALDLCIAATMGLAIAHAEGIIHRDIKPDNILLPLSRDRNQYDFCAAKLADLGLARAEEFGQSLTGSNAAVGTPGYMAPEQAMDARKVKKPADIYSMGASLYALLVGHAAFTGNTPMEIMFAAVQNPHVPVIQLRPEISSATSALIDCCLSKDPAQRYVDASALLEALRVCRKAVSEPSVTFQAIEQLTVLRNAHEVGKAIESSIPGHIQPPAIPQSPVPRSRTAQPPPLPRSLAGADPFRPPSLPTTSRAGGPISMPPPLPRSRAVSQGASLSARPHNDYAAPVPAPVSAPAPAPISAPAPAPAPAPQRHAHEPVVQRRGAGVLTTILVLVGLAAAGGVGYWQWNEYTFTTQMAQALAMAQEGVDGDDKSVEKGIRILDDFQVRFSSRSAMERSKVHDLLDLLTTRRTALAARRESFDSAIKDFKRLLDSDPDGAEQALKKARSIGTNDGGQSFPDLIKDMTPSLADREKELALARAAYEKRKRDAQEAAQRKEFEQHLDAARESSSRGDWVAVEKSIDKAMVALGTQPHPSRSTAEGLLATAKAEQRKPGEFAERIKRGEEALQAKEFEKARSTFEDARKLWPDAPDIKKAEMGLQAAMQGLSQQSYEAHIADAQRAMAAKKWTEAKDCYARALGEKPNDAQARQGMLAAERAALDESYETAITTARAALKEKKWAQAEVAFKQALIARPQDTAAMTGIEEVQSYALKDRYNEAMKQGREANEKRDWERAELAFLRALKEIPGDEPAQRGLTAARAGASEDRYENAMKEGRALLERHKWNEATTVFNLALRERAGDVAALKGIDKAKEGDLQDRFTAAVNEGREAISRERWKDAVADFNRALSIRPRAKEAEIGLVDTSKGMHRFGTKYLAGTGVLKDPAQAADWFRAAAELGLAESQHELALLYYRGNGVAQNYNEAFKWFSKAAEQGIAAAQNWLGAMYQQGLGTRASASSARDWYQRAAEQNYIMAQRNLGDMYYYGQGIGQDHGEAARWYRRAADNNDPVAQDRIGYMYQTGEGLPKDFAEAARWYQRSAEQGHAPAQNNLGYMYEREDLGFKRNYEEAMKWYRMASDRGDARGQTNLGLMYLNGMGTQKDYNEALNLFRKAAEQNHPRGQNWLGFMYENGRGVKKDHAEAFKWWRLGAEGGDMLAQWNLAVCYVDGRGCQKDPGEAVKWYKKAAAQGHEEAQKELRKLGITSFN